MRTFFLSLIVSATVLMVSCSKIGSSSDEEDLNAVDQNDDVFPVITISKPASNQVYATGDSIIVEGNVTDDKKLYKGKLSIKNDLTGFVMAEGFYETHFLSTIDYRLAYKSEVTAPTDFSILVEFQDHGLNTSAATIKVKVNP